MCQKQGFTSAPLEPLLPNLDAGYEMEIEYNPCYSISQYEFLFPKQPPLGNITRGAACNHLEQLMEKHLELFQNALYFLINFQNI